MDMAPIIDIIIDMPGVNPIQAYNPPANQRMYGSPCRNGQVDDCRTQFLLPLVTSSLAAYPGEY